MIYYLDGYKYQLHADYEVATAVNGIDVDTKFIRLSQDGTVLVRAGYAWDGPSGPTVDTGNFMRGSLVHDAFYQLMREGIVDATKWRDTVDRELQRMCREDGMSAMRAWWVYKGVKLGGESSATKQRSIKTAP